MKKATCKYPIYPRESTFLDEFADMNSGPEFIELYRPMHKWEKTLIDRQAISTYFNSALCKIDEEQKQLKQNPVKKRAGKYRSAATG